MLLRCSSWWLHFILNCTNNEKRNHRFVEWNRSSDYRRSIGSKQGQLKRPSNGASARIFHSNGSIKGSISSSCWIGAWAQLNTKILIYSFITALWPSKNHTRKLQLSRINLRRNIIKCFLQINQALLQRKLCCQHCYEILVIDIHNHPCPTCTSHYFTPFFSSYRLEIKVISSPSLS